MTTDTSRAIFLDVDGVFHPSIEIEGWRKDSGVPLTDYATQNKLLRWTPHLADLLQKHGDVMVIVHSTWRLELSNSELRAALGPLAPYYQGITNLQGRYESILDIVTNAGIQKYCILDDARDEFPANCPELILCDPMLGITAPDIQAAVANWLAVTAPAPAG